MTAPVQLLSYLLNNIDLKYIVTLTSDSILLLEVNGLNNEVFLAIDRIRYLWRQRVLIQTTYLRK